ncbi:hypothetical protein [Calycomorphotria hydatis]|uniref:Uncharacterized protein n=1 Tax=Calycomorphotria hydatis TaxID=2528027 RepID=A0A517T7E9_9PLAN|nr:hypothetical protein [Calycomorphotria hydatis]QDT64303.1 hypothetical protein V22_15350 [Calycomorphotria hydatis]
MLWQKMHLFAMPKAIRNRQCMNKQGDIDGNSTMLGKERRN